MKKLNINIVLTAMIAVLLGAFTSSCEQREDWRFPELGLGGFVKFVEQPFKWEGIEGSGGGGPTIVYYHIGADPATASFNAMVEDPNGNVSSYEVFVTGDFAGAPTEPIAYTSTTTFPYDVSFTTQEMASLFNVPVSTFEEGDSFDFTTIITTNDGKVWVSDTSACVNCPTEPTEEPGEAGSWNGGTIDGIILQGGDTGTNDILPAVYWRVYYEAPSE